MKIEERALSALKEPFQILDHNGRLVNTPPDLPAEKLVWLHRSMWMGRLFSDKIVALQRQGRAATFGPLSGQEATAVGLAAPLKPQDWLAGSYREIASYLVKGISLPAFIHTLRGYPPDETYSTEAHCLPIQIVLATQMLHAVGIAMAAKTKGDAVVAVGVCGDGATSEGDFNEALNFAGITKAPTVLVITNNGWAISTPRTKQSAVGVLAERGPGFGVPARLVDGNDVLAVYQVMSEAIEHARSGGGPTLVECLTYRMGAHSTADDPTRYRPKEELDCWKARDPITRFAHYLFERGLLDETAEKTMMAEIEQEIAEAVAFAEAQPAPSPESVFDHTFQHPTARMERQRAEMRQELAEQARRQKDDQP